MSDTQALIAKIQALPPERITEIEDFVDFIAARQQDCSLAAAAVMAALLEDRAQCALGHIAGVVGNCGIAACRGIEPDLMRACGLPAELETERRRPLDDLPVAKAGEPAHRAFTIRG
jgi:hypothetical protein